MCHRGLETLKDIGQMLPCEVVVCLICIQEIKTEKSNKFQCAKCSIEHNINQEKGDTSTELLKSNLKKIEKEFSKISLLLNHPHDHIENHKLKLKNKVQMAIEEALLAVEEINPTNKPMKCKQQPDNVHNSIYACKTYGPTFGSNDYHDIHIIKTANNSVSFSNLGNAYEHPENRNLTLSRDKYLDGCYMFEIKKIEVFTRI